jgi:hypothetical protein|tara:strand:+ start:355 stop:543 length:189 start_codon:yes stop_codon:yes gene_type:complete
LQASRTKVLFSPKNRVDDQVFQKSKKRFRSVKSDAGELSWGVTIADVEGTRSVAGITVDPTE